MGEIYFGPGGNIGKDIFESLRNIREFGLDAQELEFVHGVTMGEETAKKAGTLAKELGVRLSIHAPYYINLLSEERAKIEASKKRIFSCCRIGHILGAKSVVFHPAFYGKNEKEEAFGKVKTEIEDLMNAIEKEKLSPEICAETMGKISQFGELDELIRLKHDTGCNICLDFAHLYARYKGVINYKEIFKKLNDANIEQIHCHFSGIVYGDKGERNHIQMTDEFAIPLIEELIKHDIEMTIINESPNPLKGALDLKRLYEKYAKLYK